MKKISPCVWFDNDAEEAAKFYVSIFPNSKIKHIERYVTDTPSNKEIGSVMTVTFELDGHEFMNLNGGNYFKVNPSISFMVNFDPSKQPHAEKNIDEVWEKLSHGGKVLMPIQEYPFSKRYGWIQDKYGVSWQLILTNPEGEERPEIVPSLLFVGNSYGKAEEAVKFYLHVFKDSKIGSIMHYGPGQEPNKEGTVMFSDFRLLHTWFAAMDGGGEHHFKFNEGISFIIPCEDQEEMNYYYDKLSHDPQAEVCGWLKDKYGVSWQLVPKDFDKLMSSLDPEKKKRVMDALLEMKRLDMNKLEEAAEG